jgi:hypothetical protein
MKKSWRSFPWTTYNVTRRKEIQLWWHEEDVFIIMRKDDFHQVYNTKRQNIAV